LNRKESYGKVERGAELFDLKKAGDEYNRSGKAAKRRTQTNDDSTLDGFPTFRHADPAMKQVIYKAVLTLHKKGYSFRQIQYQMASLYGYSLSRNLFKHWLSKPVIKDIDDKLAEGYKEATSEEKPAGGEIFNYQEKGLKRDLKEIKAGENSREHWKKVYEKNVTVTVKDSLELLKDEYSLKKGEMNAEECLQFLSNLLYFDDVSIQLQVNSMVKKRLAEWEVSGYTNRWELSLLKEIRKVYQIHPVDGLKLLDWARLIASQKNFEKENKNEEIKNEGTNFNQATSAS
jgi:hypothetical protein